MKRVCITGYMIISTQSYQNKQCNFGKIFSALNSLLTTMEKYIVSNNHGGARVQF